MCSHAHIMRNNDDDNTRLNHPKIVPPKCMASSSTLTCRPIPLAVCSRLQTENTNGKGAPPRSPSFPQPQPSGILSSANLLAGHTHSERKQCIYQADFSHWTGLSEVEDTEYIHTYAQLAIQRRKIVR